MNTRILLSFLGFQILLLFSVQAWYQFTKNDEVIFHGEEGTKAILHQLKETTRMMQDLLHKTSDAESAETIQKMYMDMSYLKKTLKKERKVHRMLHLLEVLNPYLILHGLPRVVAVDVGAHVGWTTAKMVGYGHKVYAFEPFPMNWPEFWRNNAAHEDDIVLVKGAASNYTRECKIKNNFKGSFNGTDATATVAKGNGTACVKIDDIVPEDEEVFFLKVDVQGHELAVLQGAEKTIQRGVRYILIEFTSRYTPVFDWLMDHDFQCFDLSWAQYGEEKMKHHQLNNVPVVVSRNFTITTGAPGRDVWAKNRDSEYEQYVQQLGSMTTQTDLLCIKD